MKTFKSFSKSFGKSLGNLWIWGVVILILIIVMIYAFRIQEGYRPQFSITVNDRTYIIGPDAKLSEAKLSYANLSYANLSGADLRYVDLFSANLSGADLSGANLHNAQLQDANLTNANLTNVYSGYINGIPTLPTNYKLINLYIIGPGVNLATADLSNQNLTNVNLSGANLYGANLSGANLTGVISGNITGTPNTMSNGYQIINGYIIGPGITLSGVIIHTIQFLGSESSVIVNRTKNSFSSDPFSSTTSYKTNLYTITYSSSSGKYKFQPTSTLFGKQISLTIVGGGGGATENGGGGGGQVLQQSYIITQSDVDSGITITIGSGGSGQKFAYNCTTKTSISWSPLKTSGNATAATGGNPTSFGAINAAGGGAAVYNNANPPNDLFTKDNKNAGSSPNDSLGIGGSVRNKSSEKQTNGTGVKVYDGTYYGGGGQAAAKYNNNINYFTSNYNYPSKTSIGSSINGPGGGGVPYNSKYGNSPGNAATDGTPNTGGGGGSTWNGKSSGVQCNDGGGVYDGSPGNGGCGTVIIQFIG